MNKISLFLMIVFYSLFAFGQKQELYDNDHFKYTRNSLLNDYEIYSKTIDYVSGQVQNELEGIMDPYEKPFQTVIVIERMDFVFKKDHSFMKNMKSVKDSAFTIALPELDSSFTNHPKIPLDSLNVTTLNLDTVTNELFNELLDNSTNAYTKRWRKINRKFKHSLAIAMSKIKYADDYASLYYWKDCGKWAFCKTEHIIIYKRVDGEWKHLQDVYLFISDPNY